MPLTGEMIRRWLAEFVDPWVDYTGSERSEVQTFLNELFACYGTVRQEVARFEDSQHGRFLDLIWDRVCVIEMKRPSEALHLERHRGQAFDYWRNSADPGQEVVLQARQDPVRIWALLPRRRRARVTRRSA